MDTTTTVVHSGTQPYQDILESIYDGYYEVDGRARLVRLNSSLCEMLQLSREQLLGYAYRQHISPAEGRRLINLFHSVCDTRVATRSFEFVYYRSDGKKMYLEASATAIEHENGNVNGIRGIIRNISGRKAEQKYIRERENEYRSLFEQNVDAIVQFDLHGRIQGANPKTQSLFGYKISELKGWPMDVFLSGVDVAKTHRALQLAHRGQTKEYEVRIRHRNGHVLRTSVKTIPVVVDGIAEGVYAICRDVTKHHKTNQAMRRLSLQNESILRFAGEGICGIDVHGNTIFFNPAAEIMTGYKAKDVIGRDLHQLLHHTKADGQAHQVKDCAARQAIVTGQVREVRDELFWRKDGSSFMVDYVVSPIVPNDKVTGAVIVFRDVTAHRANEERLIQSEKLSVVGQLAAGIAHEIRNPLTALKGFLQLTTTTPELMTKYVDIMYAEIDRIANITTELLAFAKPQTSCFRTVNVADLMESVHALLASQALMNGINLELQVHIAPSTCIYAEADRIRQVFVNLVKNAFDALRDDGHVIIRILEDGSLVRFDLIDNGAGMDEETVKRIGEPFYTTKSTGTGLGIMVCQRIIAAHKGTIAWESELGEGTHVCIRIPKHLEGESGVPRATE